MIETFYLDNIIDNTQTCESLDVCKQDGDVLVSVDVDLPKLGGHKLPLGPLLLEGDILYDNDDDDDDDHNGDRSLFHLVGF